MSELKNQAIVQQEEQVKKSIKREVISVYKSTDGKYFENKKEYKQYQAKLDINANLQIFADKYFSKDNNDIVDISFILLNNQEKLKSILNNK